MLGADNSIWRNALAIRVPVFYSFHYANDVVRVQQIRNMGIVDGEQPVSANAWEEVKRKGDAAVQNWIDEHMKYRRCVIVLVGSETAGRKWVQYEIRKAYDSGKGLFGIYIHNLKNFAGQTSAQGANPFDAFTIRNSNVKLSSVIPCYDPFWIGAYDSIKANLSTWVNTAVEAARHR